MADKLSSPAIRELVKFAEGLGYIWNGKLSGKKHIILKHPNGAMVVLSGTPTANPKQTKIDRRMIERERERNGG